MKKFQLPNGIQDFLPKECYNKDLLESKISNLFSNNGFRKVKTGTIEYYDLFDGVVDKENINKMFKMTDIDGSLLVLRPDTTLQICRMVATKLKKETINKLYYIEDSYEFLTDTTSARTREFSQIGLEILGSSGINGDIETVILAIEALKTAGLDDFLIEIGHMGFLQGLVAESNLDKVHASEILNYINNKDMLGIERILKESNISKKITDAFLISPSLFGGSEVIQKAKKYCGNKTSLNALDNLQKIADAMKLIGYDKYINIDLGMTSRSYYSGIVLKGISSKLGVSILDGGRYDSIGEKLNYPMEAVGFSIGIKRLLLAIENNNGLQELEKPELVYINLDGFSLSEYQYIKKLHEKSIKTIKLFLHTRDEFINYCKDNNIKQCIIFSDKEKEVITF